jgi:hypothetical protein
MQLITVGLKVAKVDDEHYRRIDDMGVTWYLDDEGYVRGNYKCKSKNKNIKLHRVIGEYIGLKGWISFKDGDKLNCQSENLKLYVNTGRPNRGLGEKGISEHNYKGVTKYAITLWDKSAQKLKYHGIRDTLEEAIAFRNSLL